MDSTFLASVSRQEKTFLVGPAISTWQNSGGVNTNWVQFIKNEPFTKLMRVVDGKYFAQGGTGSNFYENFRTHIGLARDLGSNCFRLSIEWHHIEPRQGIYSPEAVKRQVYFCTEMSKNSIQRCYSGPLRPLENTFLELELSSILVHGMN